MSNNKVKILILAGGKGKRMESELPKVLVSLKGKPMISHLLESVEKSGVADKPSIVVGFKKELVIDTLGKNYDYVIQDEQLGTGHAVLISEKSMTDSNHILVLYGDNPYMTPETIKKIVDEHMKFGNKITLATTTLPDFKYWRAFFYKNFSRIIRDGNGKILKSVEFRDANDEEKEILEVNPCYFCFESKWLFENLKKINNSNAQQEYYLTDLVKMAIQEGEKIESISINPHEALAANSKEELELLEQISI